jgi:SAM-dependent methyltransferase
MTSSDGYKNDLRAAYDADVARRNAMTPASWRTDLIDRFTRRLTAAGVDRVLELGSGTGQLAEHIERSGITVTAVDLSPANVAATRARGIEAHEADFGTLPFEDASFRAAFAVHTLLHVPHDDLPGVYAEIRRVLEPGAPLLVVVWGGRRHEGPFEHEWLDPPRFFNLYPDDEMLAIDKPGFELDEFTTIDTEESSLHAQVLTLIAV